MKIGIFGSTLQAAVFAGLLAESGHHITWSLQDDGSLQCQTPQYQDSNLNQLLVQQQQAGFLTLVHSVNRLNHFDVIFLGFESSKFHEAEHILASIHQTQGTPKLIINGSTFGLNATKQLEQQGSSSHWAYLPDNIQEGNALNSVMQMKKLIVGVDSEQAQALIQEVFRPLFPLKYQYIFMPILDAEFTKLSISGMLATRISYMNDLANVAEKLGIDIQNVQTGLASDSRIGSTYLSAGAGFGGENFSHDILTLTNTVAGTGAKSRLLNEVWNINESQKEILFRKFWNCFKGDLKGKKIAIWGASFKENSANIHHSPIHPMLQALWAQGVHVYLHDPEALEAIKAMYGERSDLKLCTDQYQATQGVDALCVLTAWKPYWSPDFEQLLVNMRHPIILDGRNIYDPSYVKAQGFSYQGVGRI